MEIERKRVFKFYKNLHENPSDIDRICSDFSKIIKSSKFTPNLHSDLENTDCALLREYFQIDFDLKEEFYIFRNALSSKAVETIYANSLLDWPSDIFTKSNLSLTTEEKKQWIPNFSKWNVPGQCALDKLRWITLGCHYDWTNKVYPEKCYSPFPSDAEYIFQRLANVVGSLLYDLSVSQLTTNAKMYEEFIPEAAIVNYYRKKTNMGFHVDQAEMCKKCPLISISLGRPAIFLLEASNRIPGGQFMHDSIMNNDEEIFPIVPIVLNHGDVMVTGGSSRLAYHSVPKLLSWNNSVSLPEKLIPGLVTRILNQSRNSGTISSAQEVTSSVENYIYTTRINMNVRQVYDQTKLQT